MVIQSGVHIDCGNGRNYLPLVHGGLDLIGLDISKAALRQLSQRASEIRDRLVWGDLNQLPAHDRYDELVIGIQVFQHGTRSTAHAHIHAAQDRVCPGGLIAVRVNAVDTDVVLNHEVIERSGEGDFSVRYLEGAKEGLEIHFFARNELDHLFARNFDPVQPLRLVATYRQPPANGQRSQWEGIWRRIGAP
jgi:SAM-dependent methyltransferase